jgi:hypothetical protein
VADEPVEVVDEHGRVERVVTRAQMRAGNLRHGSVSAYEDDDVRAVATVYEVRHAGPFTFPDGEVDEVRWVPLAGLAAFLDEHPHCPDSAALLRRLGPWGNGH